MVRLFDAGIGVVGAEQSRAEQWDCGDVKRVPRIRNSSTSSSSSSWDAVAADGEELGREEEKNVQIRRRYGLCDKFAQTPLLCKSSTRHSVDLIHLIRRLL